MTADTDGFQHRRLQLDEGTLQQQLEARYRSSTDARPTLSLPLPAGGFVEVMLEPVALLSATVASQHPEISTWKVTSHDPRIAAGRAEMSALGFHVLLQLKDGNQLYIEPEQQTPDPTARNYHSFSRSDNPAAFSQSFRCGTERLQRTGISSPLQNLDFSRTAARIQAKAGEEQLNYDIAISTTAEYTAFFGSQSAALGAVVTTLNRVNQIYERDLAIHLNLITGTETIFTNPDTDGFSNGSPGQMLTENQAILNRIIGNANYDIGHVFGYSTGGDGLAQVEAACNTRLKAQGSTSSPAPKGDTFAVDFVAHELGHQFGATHTFNGGSGSCGGLSRIAETAWEPGSGSTIMAYAGICGSDNIQMNSDPLFHGGSIEQITSYAHLGTGAGCATRTVLGNSLPVANAGSDYTIPARTPFILSGSGSDSDGNALLYGWDQMDAGLASSLGVDSGNNALIMSSPLRNSSIRTIPAMSRLTSSGAGSWKGESLPTTNRNLNFRLTVRDGQGGIGHDSMKIRVYDTGVRFAITSPTDAVAKGALDVSWDVAGTDQSPISCSKVDIAASSDNGSTFTDLIRNTPNDGAETVTLTRAAQYIRVKCSDNIFFALSGTSPYLARNNGTSTTDTNPDTTTTDGGGGSLPLELLLLLGAAMIRQYHFRRKTP